MNILWIPHTGWNIPQRAHLFCRSLSQRHELHVTDWVADFSTWQDYLSTKYLRNFFYRFRKEGAIHVHGIPRFSPALFSAVLRRINERIFTLYINNIIAEFDINVVVGSFVVPPPKAPRLVFDLFDENVDRWRKINPNYALEIHGNEFAYIKCADVIVAASSVLVEKAQRLGAHQPVHLIPNGVEVSSFNNHHERHPEKSAEWVIGTVGNHDDIDQLERVLAVAELARDFPWRFVLVGRGAALEHAKRQVDARGLSNVTFGGYVAQDLLPETVSGFDVGLCPYAKTPMDDARSPMRLLVYAAAGLPTVCTELDEVRRMGFDNLVLVADNPPAIVEGIRHALELPRSRPAQIGDYDLPQLISRYEAVLEGR